MRADDIEVEEIIAEYPLIKFSVRRLLDTTDDHDYVVKLDSVMEVGYAIRNYAVQERDSDGKIKTFGAHQRSGLFGMILNSDETASYWGIYASGAIGSTLAHWASLLALTSLSVLV